jgi:hypothetical protein
MAEGFAFGTGSAIARNVVGSIMGGGSSQPQQQAPPAAVAPPQQTFETPNIKTGCELDQKELMRCLQENPSNAGNCEFYFSALQTCQQRSF